MCTGLSHKWGLLRRIRSPSLRDAHSKSTAMNKLLHLQGLRAVAILAVIGFHYFPDFCPNGYLGVDVFFVLSGYLMTMMLSKHASVSWVTVADFFYRRFKRITPLYYLVIFITTALLQFCPCSEIIENTTSGRQATLLSTNLLWTDRLDYFVKLGVSHDFFTHTWSLCLEMQFYLLFPVIWLLQTTFTGSMRIKFLLFLSVLSFGYYSSSSEVTSFNSVFCRIWQFMLGNIVFLVEKRRNEEVSKEEEAARMLEEGEEEQQHQKKNHWIFATLALTALAYSVSSTSLLTKDHARCICTTLSVFLIHFGRDNGVLKSRAMVFIGEVSYSWYLIHWPLITYQRMIEETNIPELLVGVVFSLLLATLCYFFVERAYIHMESRKCITAIVLLLVAASLLANYHTASIIETECTSKGVEKPPHYANMTIEERVAYNNVIMDDPRQRWSKDCIFPTAPLSANEHEGSCKFTGSKVNNSKTMLIIGNSWAVNIGNVIRDECSPFVEHIYRTTGSACEVFYHTESDYCKAREALYTGDVEKVKPDYLFIVEMFLYWMADRPEEQWKTAKDFAIEKLKYYSTLVKEKIFILHTFPRIELSSKVLEVAMRTAKLPNTTKLDPMIELKAQVKLDEVLATCPKCQQFDYIPKFMQNGTFYPYDTRYFVAYWTRGEHLTQPGMEVVRPVYRDICSKL